MKFLPFLLFASSQGLFGLPFDLFDDDFLNEVLESETTTIFTAYADYGETTTTGEARTTERPQTTQIITSTTEDTGPVAFAVDERLLSKMYLMVQHMEYGQTMVNGEPKRVSSATIQAKRFYYGCNCYLHKRHRTFLGSYGTPVDEYDRSCLDLQRCYASVQARNPDCDNKGRVPYYWFEMYPTSDEQLANTPLDEREIKCLDSPCSCQRMICECDAKFARQNEEEHRKLGQPADQSPFNYYNYQSANNGANIKVDSNTCDAAPVVPAPTIPQFPCESEFSLDFKIENVCNGDDCRDLSFDIFNFNHASSEEAHAFCEARGQVLLPLLIDDPRSMTVMTNIAQHIGDINFEYPDVELWLPYTMSQDNVWSLRNNGQRHCANSILWSPCESANPGYCAGFRYADFGECVGVVEFLCTQAKDHSRYTVCTEDIGGKSLSAAICRGGFQVDFKKGFDFFNAHHNNVISADFADEVHANLDVLANGWIELTDDVSVLKFVLGAIWETVREKPRSDVNANIIVKWAFGEPDFLRFIAGVVVESHFVENGEAIVGTEIYEDLVKSEYPNGLDGGVYSTEIESISGQFVVNRKVYILIEYVTFFIWYATTTEICDTCWNIRQAHFEYLWFVRETTTEADLAAFDVDNLAASLKSYLLLTADRFEAAGGDSRLVVELRVAFNYYDGSSDQAVRARFALFVELESLGVAPSAIYDELHAIDFTQALKSADDTDFAALVENVFAGREVPSGLDLSKVFVQAIGGVMIIDGVTYSKHINHQSLREAEEYCASRGEMLLPFSNDNLDGLSTLADFVKNLNDANERATFWMPFQAQTAGPTIYKHTGENFCPQDVAALCEYDQGEGDCLIFDNARNCARFSECESPEVTLRFTICAPKTSVTPVENAIVCNHGHSVNFREIFEYYNLEEGDVFSPSAVEDIVAGIEAESGGFVSLETDEEFFHFLRRAAFRAIRDKPRDSREALLFGTWSFASPAALQFAAIAATQTSLTTSARRHDFYNSIWTLLPDGPMNGFGHDELMRFVATKFEVDSGKFLLQSYVFCFGWFFVKEGALTDQDFNFITWAIDNVEEWDVQDIYTDSMGNGFKSFLENILNKYDESVQGPDIAQLNAWVDEWTGNAGIKAKFALISDLKRKSPENLSDMRGLISDVLKDTDFDAALADPFSSTNFEQKINELFENWELEQPEGTIGVSFAKYIFMFAFHVHSEIDGDEYHSYPGLESSAEAFGFCSSFGYSLYGFDTFFSTSAQISLVTADIEKQITNINGDVTYWLPYEASRGLWRRFDNGKRYCSEHSLECSATSGQCGAGPMFTTCTLGGIPDFSTHDFQHNIGNQNPELFANGLVGNIASDLVGNFGTQLEGNVDNFGNDLTANLVSTLIAGLTGGSVGNLDNSVNDLTANFASTLIAGLTGGLGGNTADDFAGNLDNNLDNLLGNVDNFVANLENNLDNLDANLDNIIGNLDKDVLANLANSFLGNTGGNLFPSFEHSGNDDHSNFGYTDAEDGICYHGKNVDLSAVFSLFGTAVSPEVQAQVIQAFYSNPEGDGPIHLTTDESFHRHFRHALWNLVKDQPHDSLQLGKWAFESKGFLLFTAAAKLQNNIEKASRQSTYQSFLTNWDSSKTLGDNLGEYAQFVPWISARFEHRQSEFLLNDYLFSFLITSSDVGELTPTHRDFLFWSIDNMSEEDQSVIDNANQADSFHEFLLGMIHRWSSAGHGTDEIVDQLETWAIEFSHSGDTDLKVKMALLEHVDNIETFENANNIVDQIIHTDFASSLAIRTQPQEFHALVALVFDRSNEVPPSEETLNLIFREALRFRHKPPCPSEKCWVFDRETNVCTPKANSGCYELSCGATDVAISFSSKLFDILDDDKNKPVGATDHADDYDECKPEFNKESGLWTWSKPLGECMAVSEQSKKLTFEISMAYQKISKSIELESGLELNFKSYEDGIRVKFNCNYPCKVELTSKTIGLKARPRAHSSLSDTGDLARGFSVDTFRDSAFQHAASDDVFVGQVLYVQLEWALKSSKFNFYVVNCQVTSEGSEFAVRMIQNNCYSTTVDAQLIGNSHYSTDSISQFSFRTFSIGNPDGKDHQETLTCDIQVCLIESKICKPVTTNENCPTEPAGYGYTLTGH